MTRSIYVTCTVSQGLFDSEFYITVKDSSMYVDRINVKVDGNPPKNGDEVEGKGISANYGMQPVGQDKRDKNDKNDVCLKAAIARARETLHLTPAENQKVALEPAKN